MKPLCRRRLLHLLLLLAVAVAAVTVGSGAPSAQIPKAFERDFTTGTMRVDIFHTGGPGGEMIALDRVVADGAWPGSRTRLVDDLNLGPYLFEVIDRDTNGVIYSRGFSSIYAEWETTAEAKRVARTYQESMRFPWPKRPVQVVIKKRDQQNAFREVWSTVVDPESRFVNRAERRGTERVVPLFESGPPAEKVDLLVIGEGYTAAQLPKFHSDAKRLVEALFSYEPFKSRRRDFNVRLLELPTAESGVHRPQAGVFRRTPIATEYNIFDTERYVLTEDNRSLRDAASNAPYEFIEILVNDSYYGGGGIFNAQATAAVDSAFSEYVFVHEFGHHFAGLADEYYTSAVAYETGIANRPEPWEPNATAVTDRRRLKWRDLVEADMPLPTPWDKETFEKHTIEVQDRRRKLRADGVPESEMDRLFREQKDWDVKLLESQKYAGKVGAFEGAAYEAKGLYRPEVDCIMFTRDPVGFCRVCRRAIERIVDMYSR